MLIDGREGDTIAADDRGLAYGDGLFETMRLEAGRVPLFDLHMARLIEGCQRLSLTGPDPDLVRREIEQVRGDQLTGIVKLIVTRGSGGRGYGPPSNPQPRRILSMHPLPEYPSDYYRHGVRVWLCDTQVSGNADTGGLKHLGRLDQVLASMERPPKGCAEGLMKNSAGHIVEGIRSNLFLVREGVLMTPSMEYAGVAGVMRAAVIEEARALQTEFEETTARMQLVELVDEVFLTSSIFGIWPVTAIDGYGYRWPPRSVTRALMNRIAQRGVSAWAG